MAFSLKGLFPRDLKSIFDPAGIFHDGGTFGVDAFGLDKTNENIAAEYQASQNQAFQAAAQEAYNQGLAAKEAEAYAKYRTAGLDAETALSEAQSSESQQAASKNLINAVVIIAVFVIGFLMFKKMF